MDEYYSQFSLSHTPYTIDMVHSVFWSMITFTIFHFYFITNLCSTLPGQPNEYDDMMRHEQLNTKWTDIQIQKRNIQSVKKIRFQLQFSSAYLFLLVYSVRSLKIIYFFHSLLFRHRRRLYYIHSLERFKETTRDREMEWEKRKKTDFLWINCCLVFKIMQFFLTIHDRDRSEKKNMISAQTERKWI